MAGETFTRNTLITLISSFAGALLGLAISIIITRTLGPEGRGIYSLATFFASLLISLMQFSLGSATAFLIGKEKYSLKEMFGTNIVIASLLGSIAIGLGAMIIFLWGDNLFPAVQKNYLFFALGYVPGQLFLYILNHMFLGLKNFKMYNMIFIIQPACFLFFAIVLLLIFELAIYGAIAAGVLSFVITCTLLIVSLKREVGGISLTWNKEYIKQSFSYGIGAHIGGILSFLQYRVDTFLLNLFFTPLMIGFYSAAVGLSEQIWLLSLSAATVLFPTVSSESNEVILKLFTPLVFRSIIFLTLVMAAFLFLFAPWIITVSYSEKFASSIEPFRILLVGAVAVSGWRILLNDLAGRGKPLLNTYVITVSLALNVILNLLFIPRFSINGAAWASTFSYTLALITTMIIYKIVSGNAFRYILLPSQSDIIVYQNLVHKIKIIFSLAFRKISS